MKRWLSLAALVTSIWTILAIALPIESKRAFAEPGEIPRTRPNAANHWAFHPPVRPPLPAVRDSGWCRTPVDRFILARLENEGMQPSTEADKTTLIRRLYLDLIGLPPTPKEVDEFVADKSPDAYSKVVERLLASPHYGERWGRHWLDAARYADSDGYEKDKSRQVYFYRDWVINAFNRDLPYNQFIIQQIAGDLLPNADQDQIVATGFLRNSMLNEEGGVDPEQFRMDAMFDRMDAIGKSILGVTIQCCQCHDHKFDPMSQEEYYRLFAFLNNANEGSRVVYTAEERKKCDEIRKKIKEIETGLQEGLPNLPQRMAVWEESVQKDQPAWTVLELNHVGDNGQRYVPLGDGSLLAQGYAPTKLSAVFKATTNLKAIRSFRLELLTDPNLPSGGPGRSLRGLFGLTEFRVETADAKTPNKKTAVKFEQATADFSNPEMPLEAIFDDRSNRKRVTGPVTFAIDGKDDTAWGIDAGPGRRNQDRKAVFATSQNIAQPNGTILTITLVQNHGGWNSDDNQNMNLGRFRISICGDAVEADPLPRHVREILAIAPRNRTKEQNEEVFSFWRTTVPEWTDPNDQIEELWRDWPAGDTALTLSERNHPRATHLLTRGDFLKPGKVVAPGVPAFLHPISTTVGQNDRLALAKWLVDPRSPTTARVFVNRIWQEYFGTGLVATSEDFGVQSERPSHPELLDWLAVEFMSPSQESAPAWSVKNLHRLIVHSAVYRQSSVVSPGLFEKDPLNRLLARMPRMRVDGEIVRDIALSASGLLDSRIGGPSVFAPAPTFLFVPPASYGPFNWIEATGSNRYRRAIYTFRRRSTPYPALQNFDSPNGDSSCVRRARSNTPMQALTTLNETVFVECARAMASRLMREAGPGDEQRIQYAFRLCTARSPSKAEIATLQQLARRQTQRVDDRSLDAAEVAFGKSESSLNADEKARAKELAVWTIVCRTVINLDETITRE
jgi:hypothetical protein